MDNLCVFVEVVPGVISNPVASQPLARRLNRLLHLAIFSFGCRCGGAGIRISPIRRCLAWTSCSAPERAQLSYDRAGRDAGEADNRLDFELAARSKEKFLREFLDVEGRHPEPWHVLAAVPALGPGRLLLADWFAERLERRLDGTRLPDRFVFECDGLLIQDTSLLDAFSRLMHVRWECERAVSPPKC